MIEMPAHALRDSMLHSGSGFNNYRGLYNLALIALVRRLEGSIDSREEGRGESQQKSREVGEAEHQKRHREGQERTRDKTGKAKDGEWRLQKADGGWAARPYLHCTAFHALSFSIQPWSVRLAE